MDNQNLKLLSVSNLVRRGKDKPQTWEKKIFGNSLSNKGFIKNSLNVTIRKQYSLRKGQELKLTLHSRGSMHGK